MINFTARRSPSDEVEQPNSMIMKTLPSISQMLISALVERSPKSLSAKFIMDCIAF